MLSQAAQRTGQQGPDPNATARFTAQNSRDSSDLRRPKKGRSLPGKGQAPTQGGGRNQAGLQGDPRALHPSFVGDTKSQGRMGLMNLGVDWGVSDTPLTWGLRGNWGATGEDIQVGPIP